MKIVVYIQVGDETGLIDAQISHMLSRGVYGFLIVDTASEDDTAVRLRKYRDDPRFDIVLLSPETVFGTPPLDVAVFGRDMIARLKRRFEPDWVLRVDADEFWVCNETDLHRVCEAASADQISVPRYNLLQPPGGPSVDALLHAGRIGEALVMAHPFAQPPTRAGQRPAIPLNFTPVMTKPLLRARALHGFGRGGHNGLGPDGTPLEAQTCDTLAILHFWFTSYERFLRV